MAKVLFDFSDAHAITGWTAIDDRIMGGVSHSRLRYELSGHAVFEGGTATGEEMKMYEAPTCDICGRTNWRECPLAQFTELCKFKSLRTRALPRDGVADGKPMQQARSASAALPRCGAYARTTGLSCKNPTMANGSGRCRMHGGKSTGPKPKHGRKSRRARVTKRWLRALFLLMDQTYEKPEPIDVSEL